MKYCKFLIYFLSIRSYIVSSILNVLVHFSRLRKVQNDGGRANIPLIILKTV